jgi:hypothetical protein
MRRTTIKLQAGASLSLRKALHTPSKYSCKRSSTFELTGLATAIGHHLWAASSRQRKVLFMPAEVFMNEAPRRYAANGSTGVRDHLVCGFRIDLPAGGITDFACERFSQ